MELYKKEILFLDSDLKELNRLNSVIQSFCDFGNYYSEKLNRIILCVSEAVMNGIIHGNKLSPDKKVEVKIFCYIDYLEVIVKDEGLGFDYNSIKDPTKKENIKNEDGRGIFILKSFCEFVEFNKEGNEIHFKINMK